MTKTTFFGIRIPTRSVMWSLEGRGREICPPPMPGTVQAGVRRVQRISKGGTYDKYWCEAFLSMSGNILFALFVSPLQKKYNQKYIECTKFF